MEINDIPHKDSVVFLEDDMVCFRLSSKDNIACHKIHNIVRSLLDDAKVIYKFIGFDEDLQLSRKLLKDEPIKYFEGKSKFKFFTISYPELHTEVSHSNTLMKILYNWSSTIYHTRVLYIVDSKDVDCVYSALERDVYKDTDSILSTWANIKIAIRNQPEAEYHNTFLLFAHKKYLESIQKMFVVE